MLGRLHACLRVCATSETTRSAPRLTAAAAWAARVVAHPPLRRHIQYNAALTSLPAGLFASGFSVGENLCVGGGARGGWVGSRGGRRGVGSVVGRVACVFACAGGRGLAGRMHVVRAWRAAPPRCGWIGRAPRRGRGVGCARGCSSASAQVHFLERRADEPPCRAVPLGILGAFCVRGRRCARADGWRSAGVVWAWGRLSGVWLMCACVCGLAGPACGMRVASSAAAVRTDRPRSAPRPQRGLCAWLLIRLCAGSLVSTPR